MSSLLSLSAFIPLASPFPSLRAVRSPLPLQSGPGDPHQRRREVMTSDPEPLQSRSPDEVSALVSQPYAMASQLLVYTALPPPLYKPSSLGIQQSPLGSHPLPELPPPSYKRSPSPTPSTSSQPSLHELPKYTPRVASLSTVASPPTPTPHPNRRTWTAWNPLNWISTPERNQRAAGASTARGRDPMAGHAGAELDACEQYEINQRQLRERQGKEDSEWCCGCLWTEPPLPMGSYYMF